MMKSLLLIFLILFGVNLFAQTSNYFENNPEWCVTVEYGAGEECTDVLEQVHYINGDTIINSISYKKLFSRGVHSAYDNTGGTYPECDSWFVTFNHIDAFVRQDGEKIFIWDVYSESDTLLYDFTLEVGDTIPPGFVVEGPVPNDEEIFPTYYGPYTIINIDSILVEDYYYKRFFFELPNGQISWDTLDYYIEGIGHHRGFLYAYAYFFEGNHYLHAFKKDDIQYYEFTDASGTCDFAVSVNEQMKKESKFNFYPNPANEILHLEGSDNFQLKGYCIYTMDGSVVLKHDFLPSKTYTINLKSLNSGMYLIEVETTEGYRDIQRFVVEK